MKTFFTTLLAAILLAVGAGSASAGERGERIPHHPNERHVLAEQLKENIQSLKNLVRDVRDVLREVRQNRD